MTRRRTLRLAAAALAIVVICGALVAVWARRVPKPVTWELRGFNMPVYSQDGFLNSGPGLQQLHAAGANTVMLCATWYMPSPKASDIRRTTATASDESLIWAIDQAHALGLKVMLKPLVDVEDRSWRANIAPDDPNRWFTQYDAMLTHYAQLGAAHDVWGLVVGNELISMSTNPSYEGHWRSMIADVRALYHGKLTYGANWGGNGTVEEFSKVPFWDALDYLGIAAYFEIASDDHPTDDELRTRWATWRDDTIAPVQRRWNRPVLFTEIGYRSLQGAASQPWNNDRTGAPDTAQQQAAYEATFATWSGIRWFAGTMFWDWSPNGAVNPGDTSYEIQNKPALTTLADWYGGDIAAIAATTTVKVYNPLSNTTAKGTVAVEAFATGAVTMTYTVAGMQPVAMKLDPTTKLWRAPLDTTAIADGQHNLTINAWGHSGPAVVDHAWNVDIANDSSVASGDAQPPSHTDAPANAPAIRIESPLSDKSYSGTIPVRAWSPDAVEVSYHVDNGAPVPMARAAEAGRWQANLDLGSLTPGRHQVVVTARDKAGTTVSDQAWNVQVNRGTQ